MKAVHAYPSWTDIEKGVALIAHQIRRSLQSPPEVVIGLTRGGLIPAVSFSHMFDIPMMPINYSSKKGVGDNKNHDNILPKFKLVSGVTEIRPPRLLIIDDICDTGHTMREVVLHYIQLKHDVVTAALYWKEGSVITPNFKWHQIPEDAPWINFPWEV